METIKVFKPCEKYVKQQFVIGSIMLVAGVIALMIGYVYLLGLAILTLVLASIQKNRDMVKLFEKNMEVKFAPLGATKFLKYTDIKEIETVSEKKIILHYNDEVKEKRLRVPIQLFDKDDLTDFLDMIKERK